MKKTVRGLTIAAVVMMVVGIVMFGFTPKLLQVSGSDVVFGTRALLTAFPEKVMSLFNPPLGLASWAVLGVLAFVLVLFVVHIIVICVNKRPSGLAVAIFFLLFGAVFAALCVIVFLPNYIAEYKGVRYEGTIPFLSFFLACYKNESINFPLYWLIIVFAEAGITALGFLFFVIADIADMVYLAQTPKAVKREYAKDSAQANDIVIVHDENSTGPTPTPEEIRDIMHDEMNKASAKPAAAEEEYKGKTVSSIESPRSDVPATSTAISGPLLVQYINTYSPAQSAGVGERRSSVPLSEIQENMTGEKSLKAEDIRKIVKEELDSQKKESSSQPLIVTVPAPAKEEEKKEESKSLTAEDIRSIIGEELKGYLAKEKEEEADPEEEPVVVEPAPEPELSAEDIRSIIREELSAEKSAQEAALAAKKAEEDKRLEQEAIQKEAEKRHQCEIEEAKAKVAEEIRLAIETEKEKVKQAEAAQKEAEARAEEEKRNALTADQIRQIISEELSRKAEPVKEEKPEQLTAEDIRAIIAQELKSVQPAEPKQPAAPVTIIVREPVEQPAKQPESKQTVQEEAPAPVQIVEEAKDEEKAPEPEPVKEEPSEPAAEETIPAAEEEPAPGLSGEEEGDEPKKRVVGQINPNLPPHEKIIRIPFPERMESADDELKNHYNELKSEVMSYGVKSRVSNSGDTFRLHKVTFLKITIAGKGLKLYFALDPKDYANTTLPIQDAGHKGTYKDIPLVFKVKSDLSFRRAKQLIADVMAKNNLVQGQVEQKDWASELKNAQASDEKEED